MYGGPSMPGDAFAHQPMGPSFGAEQPMMYGAAGQGFGQPAFKSAFARRQRPTNLAGLASCLFVPFMIFSAVYSLQTFSLHYTDPGMCRMLCEAILLLVVGLGGIAVGAWRRRSDPNQDPKWYTFMFVTAVIAWVFAFAFGNKNFVTNISPYMDIMNLNVYPSVDPALHRGQQLMDAGRIVFTQDSHLDLSISMGFRDMDTYCVAPVTSASFEKNKTAAAAANSKSLPSYDFWAVGLNCCSGHAPDFHCGEYNNVNARSGLRLMRDEQREYFRLAVKQAEAAYNIDAPHPIFMYWMQDPMSEVSAYQDDGYKFWLIGIGGFLGFQLILVITAAVVFSKLGM